MPHLTMQYSGNLRPLAVPALLLALNETLIASGEFDPVDIKSRAVALDDFLIGNETAGHGFIHIQLDLLDGRSEETRQALSESLLQSLEAALPDMPALALQLCVEIRDIHRASYAKSRR